MPPSQLNTVAEGSTGRKPDASLRASIGADTFSGPVAICGTTAVIGANAGVNGIGAAYVFQYTGSEWRQTDRLTASDGAQGDCFGCAVDIGGSTVVVGAYDCTIGSSARQGAAYVFSLGDSGWSQQQKLVATDCQQGDAFGTSSASQIQALFYRIRKILKICRMGLYRSPFIFALWAAPKPRTWI